MLRHCLLALAFSSYTLASFSFDIFPLALKPNEDEDVDRRFMHESSGEIVSVEEKTDFLKGGVIKTSKVEETKRLNTRNGTVTNLKKVTEIYRYPNGTIRRVNYGDDDFSGDAMIDCVEDHDCNTTAFCDGLHFSCIPKLAEGGKCQRNTQCMSGLKCRNHSCVQARGIDGEPCSSDDDCETNHCCASRFGENVCSLRPKLHQSCDQEDLFFSPRFFGFKSGLTTSDKPAVCPCQTGLVCKTKMSLFFLEQKVCAAAKEENTSKETQPEIHSPVDEKKDVKRSIVDNMMGLVANLLESLVASNKNGMHDQQNEIEE